MSKVGEIFTIIGVIALFVVMAVAFGFSGVKNGGYNYVKLEVNPKVEFLTDKHDKVISVFPINHEAKELIIGEDFIGLSAEDAAKKFVELCTISNYIDVEREDNAVKLTVVSGLTQGLEVKVYRAINKYLHENEIKSVIVENQNDLEEFKSAKKLNVSPNKYALMESVVNLYPDITLKEASKMSEKEMIKKINVAHESLSDAVLNYSEEELNDKVKLIDFNRAKINHHKGKITKNTNGKFSDEYTKYTKEKLKSYEENFNLQYKNWQESRINNGIA